MAAAIQVPGRGYLDEAGAGNNQVPGFGYVNETNAAPPTFNAAWAIGSNVVIVRTKEADE